MEQQTANDFKAHSVSYFRDRSEYDKAHVLLLFWPNGDLKVDEELNDLRRLFGRDLSYVVASFPIPEDGTQQARLNSQIAIFIEQTALERRSLAIIYYAGHCFEAGGKASWAAKRTGGPVLDWSTIQPSLFGALGDILLILDCCHATLIAQGRKLAGRFEVLAACAKGLSTPIPGKQSFTRALLNAFRLELIENGVTAKRLRGLIEATAQQTPFWDSPGTDDVSSIKLCKLQQGSTQKSKKKPKGYVVIRASLLDDLDGIQIADWLKANVPGNVSAVNIEAVVLTARRLQKNIDHNAFPEHSFLRRLSPPAQSEVLKQLQALDTVMAASKRNASKSATLGDEVAGENVLYQIQGAVQAASASIETPLMLELGVDKLSSADSTDILLPDDTLLAISLRERILRKHTGASSASYSIPPLDLNFPLSEERFRFAKYEGQDILLEFFEYEPDKDGDPTVEMTEHLEQMASILCHPKRDSSLTLPCIGYSHDGINHQFGIAFLLHKKLQTPPLEPVTLRSMYKKRRKVPLGQRIELAHRLVLALEGFHRVGWVHKGINSENICFIPGVDETHAQINAKEQADLSAPRLFGFEYARAATAGTRLEEDHSQFRNLYRHPQRWSRPSVRYTRGHDIYSLGVVLLEIAIWREVGEFLEKDAKIRSLQPEKVRSILVRLTDDELPHRVGETFASTIRTCFAYEEETQGMTDLEMQKCFQERILKRISNINRQL